MMMRADTYNQNKPFDDQLYKGKAPRRQDYYLAASFDWSEKEQAFVDNACGFMYDIFMKAYLGNGKYYQWDSHGQRYYAIADPYIGCHRNAITSLLKPAKMQRDANGFTQTLELPKKFDPREFGIPTCFVWNSQANCFHSTIHDIYFDTSSRSYYHESRFWEWIDDDPHGKYTILDDIPDLNHSVCWKHIKSSCVKPNCTLEHVPLRFPSNSAEVESSVQVEDIDQPFSELLAEFVTKARSHGITIPQVTKRIDKLLEKQFLSEDPRNLDYAKLKRTVESVKTRFGLVGKRKEKKEKKKKKKKKLSKSEPTSFAFSGPYVCPLCGRTTSDYNRFLVHCDIHALYTEENFLNQDSFSGKPSEIETIYKSELPKIMGGHAVSQQINQVRYSRDCNPKNNKYRARCYQYANQLGQSYRHNLSCDVVHPIRTAFPDPFGHYSKSHKCPDDSKKNDTEPEAIFLE